MIIRYEESPCLGTESIITGTKNGDGTFTSDPNGTVYKVVKFTSLGTCPTWTPPAAVATLDYLVVGGGGSGGTPGESVVTSHWPFADTYCCDTRLGTGGGGAGGLLMGTLSITPGGTYSITVGAGGVAPSYSSGTSSQGDDGTTSAFGSFQVAGGGGGAGGTTATGSGTGRSGGSGGGGGGKDNRVGVQVIPHLPLLFKDMLEENQEILQPIELPVVVVVAPVAPVGMLDHLLQ